MVFELLRLCTTGNLQPRGLCAQSRTPGPGKPQEPELASMILFNYIEVH